MNELLQSGADLRSLIEQPLQPHDSVYAIPPAIARSGHQATLDWIKKATVPALKVIRVLLLGHERSGKTSILQLLRHTGSALYTSSLGQSTDADTSPLHSMSSSGGSEARERNQRALGIDVSALQLAHDTKVVVHDFCAPIECLSSLRVCQRLSLSLSLSLSRSRSVAIANESSTLLSTQYRSHSSLPRTRSLW